MSDITIRLATLDDASQLAWLAAQLGYPTTEADMAWRLAELLQQANDAIWVATGGQGDVVAWMHLYVDRNLLTNPVAMVGGLVVDSAHRRQGIGRILMLHAEVWGRAHGCEAVYIKSNVTREGAREFYESLGYTVIKTQYALLKELE
ncbi:MAG TPA: GNAT family N-acetyltransferase [Anaerolineae bacterium]|nr:GNAT family N-acetyltransferase [Anaerolineae bacterium]